MLLGVGSNMMRLTCVLLSLAFLVGIFKPAEGVPGEISFPTSSNQRLKSLSNATRPCVVWQWSSSCKSNVTCRTTLEVKTKNPDATVKRDSFIPYTASDNTTHYQCVYDTAKEKSTCCAEIVAEIAGQEAITTPLSSADYIEFTLTICLNYSGNCASNQAKPFRYVAPWKNPCLLGKPCAPNALRCETTVANEYNCSCGLDWEGKKCEILKGASNVKDKCMANETKVLKTESNKEAHSCLLVCKNTKGCKSFVFTPDKEGSKTGSCKLYNVNSKEKALVSCPGKFFFEIMTAAQTTASPTSGTKTMRPVYPLLLVAMAAMFLLSLSS